MRIAPQLKRRATLIAAALRKAYPDAHCELIFATPLELAVGAILSAQCTDERVNRLTSDLFQRHRTAREWADTPQAVLEQEIRPAGFFRNKARNIRALTAILDEHYGGTVPDDLDTLVGLPGIGRKTANLLLVSAFNKPGIVVDTHCRRVAGRLCLTKNTDPDKIECDLKELIPQKAWGTFSHSMVFHGRYCCHARKPDCARCPVRKLCPSAAQFA